MKESTPKLYLLLCNCVVKVIFTFVLLFYFYNLSAQCTAPVVTATPSAQTICSGDMTSIILNSDIPGTVYSWTVVQNGVTGASIGNSGTIAQMLTTLGSSVGTAVYTVNSLANGCSGNPINVTVTVNPPININTTGVNSICSGNNLNIGLSSSTPNTTFYWTIGTITGSISGASAGTGTNINQTLVNPSNSTAGSVQYMITATSSNSSCTGQNYITTTVKPIPKLTNSLTKSICSGTSTNMSLTSSVSSSFSWTVGTITGGITGASSGSGSIINQTLNNPNNTTPENAEYVVTPISNSGSCVGISDNVTITVSPIPVLTNPLTTSICSGTNTNITLTANIASTFSWSVGSITGNITGSTAGSGNMIIQSLVNPSNLTAGTVDYLVTPSSNGCSANPTSLTVTVNPNDDASFSYASATFCQTGINPTLNYDSLDRFSAIPFGLAIDSLTGTIDLPTSSLGTYTISNATAGTCSSTSSITMTITAAPSASFTYSDTLFCKGTTNPVPAFSLGTSAGTFSSSPPGLNFTNVNTGVIDLLSCTAGTYVITNTIPASGGCAAATAIDTITISEPDDASFSYSTSSLCATGQPQSPVITGLIGGYFSANSTGLTIDSVSGIIQPSTSTIGNYVISYTTTGVCITSSTASVTVNSAPSAGFSYSNAVLCPDSVFAIPVFFQGSSAGIFSASPAGIDIITSTGMVNMQTSDAATYIVTNTIPANNGCAAETAIDTITIAARDNSSFSYSSYMFCTTASPQTPLITGLTGGTFSASPAGLAIDPLTGVISFSMSAQASYFITYTTSGTCPSSSSHWLTVSSDCNMISGYTYLDTDMNCQLNSGDSPLANIPVKLYNSNNVFTALQYTYYNGTYNFRVPDGTYKVKFDTLNISMHPVCNNIDADTIVTLNGGVPLTDINFGLTCGQTDFGIQFINAFSNVFPGVPHGIRVSAGNLDYHSYGTCLDSSSGQLQLTITGPVTYNGPQNGALIPSVSGNVYTYNIANFDDIDNFNDFKMKLITDTSAQIGDTICVYAVLTSSNADNNLSNNSYQFCYYVGNSYDPNKKEVYPLNVQPGYQDWFTYTIHFQNTGNAPAMNIRLRDTLDMNLDLETFEVIGYSDTVEIAMDSNALNFYFPNIMLPDSTSDPEGSQGFVQYRIKPKSNLQGGTQIKNTAFIYFDYNSPIVTNTTVNEFLLTTDTDVNKLHHLVRVFPNPGNGKYYVEISKEIKSAEKWIEVYNIFGSLILQTRAQSYLNQIDLSQQTNGIYIVKILCSNGEQVAQRIIKQQ